MMDALRTVDHFSTAQVAGALGKIKITPSARAMLDNLAKAPDRAMSRLELARSIGCTGPQTCNGVLGHFGRSLALELDASLAAAWKPQSGSTSDWVKFLNWGPERWTRRSRRETDGWVFVMRETLARALQMVGLAPYQGLSERARCALRECYPEFGTSDPFLDVACIRSGLTRLSTTERQAIRLSRVGQGQFREAVLQQWGGRCAVTGAQLTDALVASHIKPWRDSTNEERLDPANGLLLTPGLDRLFDLSLVTFDSDGSILISSRVREEDYAALGLSRSMRLRPVPSACTEYLAVHREQYFTP